MAEAEADTNKAQATEAHDTLFADNDSSDEEGDGSEADGSSVAATKAAAKGSADKSGAYDDEGDEDDEEGAKDLVDNFIALDEDDLRAGVLEEYQKQKQDFNDEYDPDFEQPDESEKGSRAGGARGVRVVVAKMDRQTALDTIEAIVNEMDDAAEEDDAAVKRGEPAFEKLQKYGELMTRLRNYELREYLLDHESTLLHVLSRWISPSSAGGLCALEVRTAVYDLIDELDIHMELHLTRNDLGKVLMSLCNNPNETAANRRKITTMIEKWTLQLQDKFTRRRAGSSYGKKRKMANSTSYLDQKRAEAAASNDALERSVTTAREAKPQAVYTEMKLVQMGTDRMRRKQARLSKRFVEPEKRNSNTIMAQLRRAKAGKK